MGSRAIYTVIENGEAAHFYSQWAANEYTPFAVIHTANNLKNELVRQQSTAQLLPMIKYNRYFEYEAGFDGYTVLERLKQQQAETMLSNFGNSAAVNMHITLDLDKDRAVFEHNGLCYHSCPADFSIRITEGLRCMEEVVEEAENSKAYLPAIIESKMSAKIKEAILPLEQEGSANTMNL